MTTEIKVLQDYIDQFVSNLPKEIVKNTITPQYPREEKALLSILGDLAEIFEISGAIIAGGAITSLFTNQDINDIDIYFRDKESLSKFLAGCFSGENGYVTMSHMSDRSLLMTNHRDAKLQLITYRFFEDSQDIFGSFDFSVNMGAYDFKTGEFVFHPNFLKHNAQRYLEVNTNTAFPLVSALRVDKYRQKGYNISKPQMIALLYRISQLKLESWEDVLSHTGGMYGVDPDNIFDKTQEFSVEEAIRQIQLLETVDGKWERKIPTFKELTEKLSDKLTEELKTALIEYSWNDDGFLKIAFGDEL